MLTNFDPEGTEFDDWDPQDWKEDIPVYQTIQVNDVVYYIYKNVIRITIENITVMMLNLYMLFC